MTLCQLLLHTGDNSLTPAFVDFRSRSRAGGRQVFVRWFAVCKTTVSSRFLEVSSRFWCSQSIVPHVLLPLRRFVMQRGLWMDHARLELAVCCQPSQDARPYFARSFDCCWTPLGRTVHCSAGHSLTPAFVDFRSGPCASLRKACFARILAGKLANLISPEEL